MSSITRTNALVIAAAALTTPTTASAQLPPPVQVPRHAARVERSHVRLIETSTRGDEVRPAPARAATTVVESRAAARPASTIGGLPFTGAELSTLCLAGLALLTSGAILRRIGYARRQQARG